MDNPKQHKEALLAEQTFNAALTQHSQGNNETAELLLRDVIKQQPTHAHALHLLGIIAYQNNQPLLAIESINNAILVDGKVARFHTNIGEMYRHLSMLDKAVVHGERAVSLEPALAAAHANLGLAYYDLQQYTRAEACQRRALFLNPNLMASLNNLGSIYASCQQIEQAIGCYKQAMNVAGGNPEPLNNLGALLVREARAQEGIIFLQKAVEINPNYMEALFNLGNAYFGQQQFGEASQCYVQALRINPQSVESLSGLAKVHIEMGRMSESLACINRAIEIEPDHAMLYIKRATTYQELGFLDKAVQDFDLALSLAPENINVINAKALFLAECGDWEQAEKSLRMAVAIAPQDLDAYCQLANIKKVKKGDDYFDVLLKKNEHAEQLSDHNKVLLHFALGKCHEDIGDYDAAFNHFIEGNKIKRAQISYSAKTNDDLVDVLRETFTPAILESLKSDNENAITPIFVVGMARSGTTLIEQIISSHPLVYGAGEIPYLLEALRAFAERVNIKLPEALRQLSKDQAKNIANEYLAKLSQLAGNFNYATDKLPSNFLLLGLIIAIFPKAKIIHVKRNPLDTCVSGFTRLFPRGQDHSYTLSEMGNCYKNYVRIIDHWRQVLPKEAFFEIQYEDVVNNVDASAQQLLEYCGLAWDEQCLAFYENKRQVRTISIAQVRQPIYKTSVEKWRHYDKYLTPLREALGEFNPSS